MSPISLILIASSLTLLEAPLLEASQSLPEAPLYFNTGRGYAPFRHATTDGILLSNPADSPLSDSITLPVPAQAATLSFRIDNRHAHPSRRYSYRLPDGSEATVKNPTWSLFINDSAGQHLSMTISSKEFDGPLSSEPYTSLHLSLTSTQTTSSPQSVPSQTPSQASSQTSTSQTSTSSTAETAPSTTLIEAARLPFHGETLWTITLTHSELSIVAGAHEPSRILTIPNCLTDISSFGFTTAPGGEILLSDIALIPSTTLTPTYDPDTLATHLTSTSPSPTANPLDKNTADPLEGYWQIFDRSLEESLLRLGGEYKIAIVKDDHDRYAIVYLAGARVNAGQWQPGTVKGWLTPTPFPGLFDLEWLDAEGKPLSKSITAQLTDEGVLTIQFPYQSSTIRLRKL